jgi:hypothetical protein
MTINLDYIRLLEYRAGQEERNILSMSAESIKNYINDLKEAIEDI